MRKQTRCCPRRFLRGSINSHWTLRHMKATRRWYTSRSRRSGSKVVLVPAVVLTLSRRPPWDSIYLDTMATLMDAGVADSGRLLRMAAARGLVAIVMLLLQQRHRGRDTSDGEGEYVNLYDGMGMTPLFYSIDGDGDFRYLISPKVVRLLIDAGADTSSGFLVAKSQGGEVLFSGTPLAYTNHCIREKQVGGEKHAATEEQMYRLEAVRRLLMRVEAVHAACWLWPREPHPVGVAAQVPSRRAATKTPENGTHLVSMLPILRRRRRGVLLAPLFRWAGESFHF